MGIRASSPNLVGRVSEMARLTAAYERARQSIPQTLVIQGDAGIGKSRLVAEFLTRVRGAGDVAVLGRCANVEGGLPFGPIVDGFRHLIAQRGSQALPDEIGLLAPILPELEDAEQTRKRPTRTGLFHAMASVLTGVGCPIAFVIEDAHWSDRSTRDAVGFLVQNLVSAPVMWIVTIRADEPDPAAGLLGWLGELKRSSSTTVLGLDPLDREGARLQIEEIMGSMPSPEVVETIYRRSQGNPFFVEELIAAGVDADVGSLPSLADVFLGRVAAFDEEVRELLRAVAVSELGVTSDALAQALETDPHRVARALRRAVSAQLLVRERDDHYAFRHALLRELLYDELTSHERRRYHGAYAEALSTSARGRDALILSQIAQHWWEAEEPSRAREAFITAAEAAEAALAHAEAMRHLVDAAELSEELGAGDPPVDLLYERAARSAASAGDWAVSVELLGTALERVDRSRCPERAAHLMGRLAWTRWTAFHDPARALLEDALQLIPAHPPTASRARLLRTYAYILENSGQVDRHLHELNAEAVDVARQSGDQLEEGLARVQAGTVLTPEMSPDLGPVLDALMLIKQHGTPDDILDASVRIGDAMTYLGDFESLLVLMKDALALATDLQIHTSWPGLHLVYSNALFYLGRWSEIEELENLFRGSGPVTTPQAMTHLSSCPAWLGQGRFDKVRDYLELLAVTVDESSPIDRAQVAHMAALYYLWTGDLKRASDEVRAGIGMMEKRSSLPNAQELFLVALQVEAARHLSGRSRTDDTRFADLCIEGARRAAREGQDRLSPIILEWSEAEYARAKGQNDLRLWSEVATGWQRLQIPWFEAWARWRQAEALLMAGAPRAEAIEALSRARELASRLGAGPLLQEVEGLAQRARLVLPSQEESSDAKGPDSATSPIERFGLTARELEVLRLVTEGKTNPEIAEELFITRKTASAHVSHILAKLGVSRRGEAASIAHAMNLTPTPSRSE
jgi:DNA-binding CsgD family transcriptional regulator